MDGSILSLLPSWILSKFQFMVKRDEYASELYLFRKFSFLDMCSKVCGRLSIITYLNITMGITADVFGSLFKLLKYFLVHQSLFLLPSLAPMCNHRKSTCGILREGRRGRNTHNILRMRNA